MTFINRLNMRDDIKVPKPSFLITIDTEGDNIWAYPRSITTRNARFLPRFQELCERFGFKATYLTNYEMAIDPFFIEFGSDVIERGTGEIGMHLHAWNSPPMVPLTTDDFGVAPYLIEYPDAIMEEKIAFMTGLLQDNFGVKMISHRAGRWAFDERYARMLVKYGYTVDCSVTPGVTWRHQLGSAGGAGGTDFSHFPAGEYFVDLDDISRAGGSSLLELPMSIAFNFPLLRFLPITNRKGIAGRLAQKVNPPRWLRPNGANRLALLKVVGMAAQRKLPYIEFILHSSEFMPGGSPVFPDDRSIEILFDDIECLFEDVARTFDGATLGQYRTRAEHRLHTQ